MTAVYDRLRDGWEKTWPGIHCALRGGLPDFVYAADPPEIGTGVPVFYFHTVDPRIFEADLSFFRRNGYTTITADALADHLEGVAPAPARSVVLTFDDGPRNLVDVVFPMLRDFELTAVAFIAPWFHEPAVADWCGFCTWSELESMHESGRIDFQSHTWAHRFVPRWPEPLRMTGANGATPPPPDEHLSMREDFHLARRIIEERLGKTVRHLAFPRYRGTDEAVAVGRAAGYRAFWWGGLPHRPLNRPGDAPTRIARINSDFLRRLPGTGRLGLTQVLKDRYARRLRHLRWRLSGETGPGELQR